MVVTKIRPIECDLIGIDSILLDPAVPEISYFKHDVVASNVIIFTGNFALIAMLPSLRTPSQF